MKKGLTILLVFLGISAFSQIDLEYNLKKGQTYKIATIADQTVEQEVMGNPMNVKQKITMGISYEVVGVSNEVFEIKCTYYRVAYESLAMGMEVNYDSENPTETIDPAAIGFSAIVDKSFSMKFNKSGEVTEVTGFEKMINEMVDGFGNLDEESKAVTKEQLQSQFGGEQLKKTMEQSLKLFPTTGKAKKGDTWSITSTLGMYAMDISSNYDLVDYNRKTATINVSSQIEPSTFTQNTGEMEMDMEMSGSQLGQMIIDRSSGMLISGKVTQDLIATAKAMGMTIPMKIKSKNTFLRED